MDNLKVLSLNTRGMRDGIKRRRIFRYLKREKPDVCFLQETHSEKNHLWESEWGGKGVFADGNTQSRGVAILFSNKISKNICDIVRDINGRYVLCSLKINNCTYCCANIYAPTDDNPEFFRTVNAEIENMDANFVILGGDFNVVQDPKIDRSTEACYNPHARESIDQLMEQHHLLDVWRAQNPDTKYYTWMRPNRRDTWSRIDYFLVSESLSSSCISSQIKPCIISDHSLISLSVSTSECKRGPGVWKFNNELLEDETFCNELKQLVLGSIRVYHYLNAFEFWELLKTQIREFSRKYSKEKANNYKYEMFSLYKALGIMQEEEMKFPVDMQFEKNIAKIKAKIEAHEIIDAIRAAFRCKVNYTEGGERNVKYFFNLEKRNFSSKTMYVCRKPDGTLTKDYREILNLQYEYYQNLYALNTNVNFTLRNSTGIVLPESDRLSLEADISKDEIFDAIMTLKPNKCPGGDGLTVELYRKLFKEIARPLLNVYQMALEKQKLNPTGRRGIINLIPKKGKNELELKNWRPISILNYDFKILSKLITNRLELVVPQLIGQQQTGFLKGRSIFTNIRKTMEVVIHKKRTNTPGIVAMVDFEKCFDKINHLAIKGVFQYFGFGPCFIRLLFLLYNDLEMCTVNNGYVSELFEKQQGINQGCCASPMVYTVCSETMSHLIYGNTDIRGIDLHELKNVLAQFADDTGAYLQFEETTINNFINALQCAEAQMGLKVSYDKTTLYRIGSIANSDAKCYTTKNIKWSNGPIDTLGMMISCTDDHIVDNFQTVMNKVKAVCKNWYNRSLSLSGRILVVNSLIGSLFVYKMMTMCNLKESEMKEIETVIREFIWKGKRSKIALETLYKPKTQGGLKLVNLKAKQDALKISWIFKVENDNILLKCLQSDLNYCNAGKVLRQDIWRCNIAPKDCIKLFPKNNFWSEMLYAWSKINFNTAPDTADILEQVIWLNSHIRIDNKPVVWKKCIDANIMYVKDLYEENGIPKSPVSLGMSWLEQNQLLAALPHSWKAKIRNLARTCQRNLCMIDF